MAIACMVFVAVIPIYGIIIWVQINELHVSVKHNFQSNSSGLPAESMYNYIQKFKISMCLYT